MPTPWPQPCPVTINAVPARADPAVAQTRTASAKATPNLIRTAMFVPPPRLVKRGRLEPSARIRTGRSARWCLDSGPMRRLLVANRGEIALRIFRACRAEGVETVAVAAPDDRGSLHAESGDALVEISSYLDPAEHVRAARESESDAVHPGYGFLSESAELAEAVLEAGLTWVGPPPSALRAGGDKLAAKETAREAGVPVLPSGTPEEIGFPLLVKAAAGGGGRGMRVVRAPEELEDA